MALFNPTVISTEFTGSISTTNPTSNSVQSFRISVVNNNTVELLAPNAERVGATIFNDADGDLRIDFDTSVGFDYLVKIAPGGYFEVPFNYTGVVSGNWSNASGAAYVREFTNV